MNKDQKLPHDLAHRLRLLEVLDRIAQASLASENMEDVLRGVLDLVLEVFNADRAWFLYPCDPDTPSWGIPMERTRPGWPGLSALGEDIPTSHDAAEIFSELLRANDTVQYSPHTDHPVPQFIVERFSVKSQLMIALRPKIGKAWVFGLHHCASEVIHDEDDLYLFTAIAHRISDSLSSLISIRQLRESEERHRRIIETTQEGFGEIDSAGRIISANSRCAEMFRYSPGEFIGLNIVEDLLFPIDRENMLEQMNRRRRGEAGAYEQRFRAKDRDAVWVLVSATPIKDESGAVCGSFAMMTDITERKRAETEREITLRKAERTQAMLQTVLDSTPDWIFAKDKNYRFLFVNRAFAASQGCMPQDMAGRPDTDFWSAELCNGDPARGIRGFHADDDAAIADGLIHNPSDPATLSDGKLHIFDTLKLPLLDADGHCYGVLGYARDVTERKDAERLSLSEALLRQTQSLANIGSWQLNVPSNELVWSDETYRIFGIPVGTPLDYERFIDQIHPDDRPLVDSAWQAALKGAPYCIQHRIVVDGETRWVEERAQLDFDAQGNLDLCTGSAQDITERKQAEKALHESESRWRSFTQNSPDHIIMIDPEEVIRFINHTLPGDLTPEQIVGTSIYDYLPEKFRPIARACYQRVLDSGLADRYETEYRDVEGNIHYFEARVGPVKNQDQVTALIISAREITERKQAIIALQESERNLRQAQEIAHIGSWTFDMAGQITWTDEMYRIYGASPETFTPNSETFINLIHPDDRPAMQAWIDACVSGQKPEGLEFRCVWPDGTIRYIYGQGGLIFDADGKPGHMAGTAQDITERQRAEALLRKSETHLRLSQTSGGIGTWEADLINNRQEWSGNCISILGFPTLSEPTWEDFLAVVHPEDRQRVIDSMPSHIDQGTKYEVDFRIIAANGNIRWVHSEGQVERNADGKPILMRGAAQDITERKQIEAELRIASTAFSSQESMIITDADGVILRVNKAFTEDTGYTAEEVVGQTPRLLKSGRHNADFYREMWETIHRTGIWQGEIWDRRKNGEIFPKWLTISAVKGENGIVTHYVGSHIDITERKAAEDEIQQLAFYDPLTHLPNRRLLLDRLQQALASSTRSSRKGALLFIDLDDFKTLNDTLGHDIGDLLLQQVAQRLKTCVRDGDTVARLGGDEFLVILEDLSEHPIEAAAQTEAVGKNILDTLCQPYQLATHKIRSTPSIGATLFGDHQRTIDELFKQADISMYQAKKAGRNTLRFFDPQMQVVINTRVELEGELRQAIESRQFHLYYQIQVDNLLCPLGAEALIRWMHPERGLVSPAQFIPLAEETGLILPIGKWVIETACAQIKKWQQDALTRDLVLAVNVSANQFRQIDFVAQVQAAVQHHAINPRLLKLELTESLLLENIEDTIATMNALNKIGVQFSLDDFGTGYSSLQYLKRLPLDQLKIDQSFVRDIATDSSDRAIVRTIIAMAQSLNLDVIAEGVETEEQRQRLFNKGCTHYQGYLFGKPVPIEQFEALLKQS